MKIKLSLKFLIPGFFILMVGAVEAFAQQPVIPQMTGAYGSVAASDAQVVKAANFAVRTKAKTERSKIRLISINSAALQVVSGLNYKLCLNIQKSARAGKKDNSQIVEVVVYRNLKNHYSLTSWTVGDCQTP